MTKSAKRNLLTSASPVAFNNKGGWKMDGDKIATDANGNPIFVRDDGNEQAVEGNTISRLNAENKTHREAKEAAEAKLKTFEGLDADKARDALDKLGRIDQKALIDAGEVDRVRGEISTQYQGQLTEAQSTIQSLQSRIDNLTLSNAFGQSSFIAERVAVPREMFEATFGKNFKVEDGKIVPYDQTGNRIYSKKRMGEIADLDEAFELMVENYPHKESILRAPDASGSGSGGGGGARGGSRTIRRADFAGLSPADQAAAAQSAAKGELQIVD